MQLIETHVVKKLESPTRFQEYGVGIFNSVPTKSGIERGDQKRTYFY